MKILFVEDDTVTREAVYSGLSQVHEVVVAANGSEARDYLDINDCKYDAIVTDIHMPKISGFGSGADLIEYMVQKDKHIPIIVVTGYDNIADTYREYGCVEVMNKPLVLQELLLMLKFVSNKTYGNCSRCSVKNNVSIANLAVMGILKHLDEVSDE